MHEYVIVCKVVPVISVTPFSNPFTGEISGGQLLAAHVGLTDHCALGKQETIINPAGDSVYPGEHLYCTMVPGIPVAFDVLLTKPLSGASSVGQKLFDEPEDVLFLALFVPKMAPMIPPHTRMSNRTAIPMRLLVHVLRCKF